MREAAEVDRIREFRAACFEALVATRRHRKEVTVGERLGHLLPEREAHLAGFDAMLLHLHRETGVRSRRVGELAARESAARESIEPGDADEARAFDREHAALAAERGIVETDRAARVAEIGVAGGREDAAALLVQPCGEPAHFRREGRALASHLAEMA